MGKIEPIVYLSMAGEAVVMIREEGRFIGQDEC